MTNKFITLVSIFLVFSVLVAGCERPQPSPQPELTERELFCEFVSAVIEKRHREREEGLSLSLEPVPEWVAGPTDISNRSDEELRMLSGVRTEDSWGLTQAAGDRGVSVAIPETTSANLPSHFDWRDYEGGDWTTPIRNQDEPSECRSCVAFAAVAVMESLLERASEDPNMNPDLSEQWVFFRGCGECCDTGWKPGRVAEFLHKVGVPGEDCCRYNPETGLKNCRSELKDHLVKAESIRELTTPEEMKRSLVENGPLLATIAVHRDLFCYQEGVYQRLMDCGMGGHAVAIVGYDDEEQYWIVKNSWGDAPNAVGERGWLRIGYGEVGIDERAIELVVSALPRTTYSCE